MNCRQVLEEFVEDVEQVGVEYLERDWPDLLVTFNKAREALKSHEHTWDFNDGPADGIREYTCGCGAEMQAMDQDGFTQITIHEPRE